MFVKRQVGLLILSMEMPDSLRIGLDYFVSQVTEKGIYTDIRIEICYCAELPCIINTDNSTLISMKNINYYYNQNKCIYIAINNYAYGIIDCQKEYCKWYILESFKNMRSIFHTCILDPISLLGVRYGFVVLHAAMIGYRNKGIAIMGKSGSGKSTISMLMAQKSSEYQKYSDDTVQVHFKNTGMKMIPIFTGEGYFVSIADTHLKNKLEEIPTVTINEKRYYFPKKKEVELPLCMIVLLKSKSDFSKTVLLNVHESLTEILQIQMHIVGPHLAKWFAHMNTLVSGIPILNKQYKEVCNIDEIITEIENELL